MQSVNSCSRSINLGMVSLNYSMMFVQDREREIDDVSGQRAGKDFKETH